jgi:hypothetical protein
MRYYTYTITDDTGTVKSVEGVPFEDEFKLKRRLFDPRPFALDEWTDNAVALYDEDEDIPPTPTPTPFSSIPSSPPASKPCWRPP